MAEPTRHPDPAVGVSQKYRDTAAWHDGLPDQQAPLYLDGLSSWRTYATPKQAKVLSRVPTGTELIVEAIPQSAPSQDVALWSEYGLIGHIVGGHAVGLCGAITAANTAGYRVLMHAKRIAPDPPDINITIGYHRRPSDSMLEVRTAASADLYYWLQLPAEQRAHGFFQLAWASTTYQSYYQAARSAILGDRDSVICPCTFSTNQRFHDPYSEDTEHGAKLPHPAIGKFADVHTAGRHIGELRLGARNQNDEGLLKILAGRDHGMARLDHWRDYTDLRVCIPDANGRLPVATDPFIWGSERRAAADAAMKPQVAAREAEKIHGRPVATYKNEFRALKGAGQLEKARDLGMKMVEAAERAAVITKQAPNRWYTWETAVILRKLKDRDSERALLQRFLDHCPPGCENAKVRDRLARLG